MRVSIISLWVLVSIATSGSPSVATASQDGPWTINEGTLFPGGQPANSYVAALMRKVQATEGPGRALTPEEFSSVVRRTADVVYADPLVKYATPLSRDVQKKEHEDFTKVFLQERRVLQGISFLQDKGAVLGTASEAYATLPEDVVAILMWESGLGEFAGDYLLVNTYLGQILFMEDARNRAVETLNRQGGAYPPRLADSPEELGRLNRLRNRAVENLAILLRMAKAEGMDATTQRGSWGGAIGYVQFLPQSLEFAVDGDHDGRIDLTDWDDCIYSVANYLKLHGYGPSDAARRRSFRAYNPSDAYARGVLLYARTIRKRAVPAPGH